MVGKKKSRIQFKYGKRRKIRNCSLSLVCANETLGQGVNKTIFDPPPKGKGEVLTFEEVPIDGGGCIFE